MSLDLYQRETAERIGTMPAVREPEPGVFDNYWRGAGLLSMRGLARAGRSIDLLGAVGPVIQDAFTGGTVAQDRYFKEHEEHWGSAADYWMPRPGEVGVAGEITGQLLGVLPMIFASPGLAIGEAYVGTAEDLQRKGVDTWKAQQVGAAQAVGLGLGIWVPVLGRTLFERMVIGGAGFNVLQGVTTRGVSGQLLEGTPEAKAFQPFDPTALTIDVLLGLAFGGWAHLNPEMRAQGKGSWERIQAWAQGLSPSQVAALATLRQAQHLNVDSTPGRPASPLDVEAHVTRARQGIEQVIRGQPVDVTDLPAGTFKPDPERMAEMRARAEELVAQAERVRVEEGLPRPPEADMATARAEGNLEAMAPPEQAAAIGRTIRAQLETSGMPLEEASANATLWESFFRTAGERYGVAPAELMKRYGVDVRRLAGDEKLLGALEQAGMRKDVQTYYQARAAGKTPAQIFYSELARQVDATTMNQAPAKGWKDLLKSFSQKGVRAEELKWSGLEEWLDLQSGKVTKAQVQAFLKANGVRVTEVTLGKAGEKTLGDRAISGRVDELSDRGFDAEVDPEDASMVAFVDRETSDIITSHEIRTYARQALEEGKEGPDGNLHRAAQLAAEIERYWAAPTPGRQDLELALRQAGWNWRVVDEDFQIYRRGTEPEGENGTALSVSNGEADATPGVPDNVLDTAQRLEAIVMQGADEAGGGRPTKFGQYQLPGGKDYRELLLTLPRTDPTKLPKGWRIEELGSRPDQAPLDALIDEWKQFREARNIPEVSADEIPRDLWARLSQQDQELIYNFRERWDTAIATGAAPARYTLIGPDGVGRLIGKGPATPRNMEEAHDIAIGMLERSGELDKVTFRESHWEEPNVLAHVRYNERTDADGKKVLFIEEIQSDWAQKGKKLGFQKTEPVPTELPEGTKIVKARTREEAFAAGDAAYVARDRADAETERTNLIARGIKAEDILIAPSPNGVDKHNVYVATYEAQNAAGDVLPNMGPRVSHYTEQGVREGVLLTMRTEALRRASKAIPNAPFVGKTEAWVGLVLKRMIREAAERGFDKIAWTSGEQQAQRYTQALRHAVDEIEWTKTEKGVQIIGYKGGGGTDRAILNNLRADVDGVLRDNDLLGFDNAQDARRAILEHPDWAQRWDMPLQHHTFINNWRRLALANEPGGRLNRGRTKVVDTTEREDMLSDAIGKAMAERIISDPAQAGVISGEGIVVTDTGQAAFYDRMIPNIAKEVLRKLGGGKIGTTKIETGTGEQRPPVVRTSGPEDQADAPHMGEIEKGSSAADAFAGADDFADGPAIYGESRVMMNDEAVDVAVLADRTGIHIIGADAAGTDFELLIPMEHFVTRARFTQAIARRAIKEMWNPGPTADDLWNSAKVIHGDFKTKAQTEQMAFEITPEMKQKALGGLPLFQRGERGQIQFGDGQTIIGLLEKADRSTFLHETGHFFLQVTRDLSTRPEAPEGAKADWATIQKWLGIEGAEIPVEAHEKFARGFEAYLMTGQAPSAGLRTAFERFRDWLLEIYDSIRALEVDINDDIRAVMDRMLELREAPEQPGVPRPAIEDTPRARETVEGYRERLEAGEQIEPVLVDRTNTARIVDGNHRMQAHLEAGTAPELVAVPATEAIVKMGTEGWTPTRVATELGRPIEAEAPAATRGETEPPPPRGSRPGEAAGAEARETTEAIARQVEQLGIQNAKIRELLTHMAEKESGWESIGGRLDVGRLVRETGQKVDFRQQGGGLKLGTPAFTKWIPRAEWWTGRPDKKMNERKVKEAVEKALAGEPLKAAEQRTIDYMVRIAEERAAAEREVGPAEFGEIVQDMALGRELEPTVENVLDVDAVARARELNEAAVERAAIQYENDDAGFMAQVRSILEKAEQNLRAQRPGEAGGGEAPGAGGRAAAAPRGAEEPAAGEAPAEGEGPDAVTREAERFVEQNPDRLITVGNDPSGEPITVTVREYLESARAEAAMAREDAELFEIAAQCLLGGGSA